MLVVVGRIGRAHGIRGELTVEVRTDDPELRFAPGTTLSVDSGASSLTVATSRWHSGRLLLTFEGVSSRDGAEALRNTLLSADVDPHARPEEDDAWYDHQLVGLTAHLDDRELGPVTAVVHLPGQDLLEIGGADAPVLVPFVSAFVPEVDIAGGRIRITPPPGLLDDEQSE